MVNKKSVMCVCLSLLSMVLLGACEHQECGTAPQDVYCMSLGYGCEIRKNLDGSEYSVCMFPDGTVCDSWQFFRGACGPEWTYCEKNGYEIQHIVEDMGGWTAEYAVCVFDDGSECLEQDYMAGTCHPSQCTQWRMSQDGCVEGGNRRSFKPTRSGI